MKKILITVGTVFVSQFIAYYFVNKNYDVYVHNRNTKEQVKGTHLILADRDHLTDELNKYLFNVVIDVCAYTKKHIENLLDHINPVKDYIFISSSAIYPESNSQPFQEDQYIGLNSIWGQYGINKVEAEQLFISKHPQDVVKKDYISFIDKNFK